MKLLLLAVLISAQAFAHERSTITKADQFAFGTFREQKNHPWPFPLLSIGHNMQSFQNYGMEPYWHDGLDIRSTQDQPIYAAAGGRVVNIENYQPGNPMYWEVAIQDDEGFVWKYHHVAKDSITAEVQASFRSSSKLKDGALIGNVVRWPITTYGEVYHHLHLYVLGKDKKYINPFLMMVPLQDTQAPIINKIGIAKNHKPISGDEVSGAHALYLDASDLTLHQKFILPPYKISYQMDGRAEKVVWEFINLPSGDNDHDFIEDFYMKGTCGNYTCRKFYFNLNFTQASPRGTMNLAPGMHSINVTVEDIVGNKTEQSYSWNVK